MKNKNINLFWYGAFANIKIMIGWTILVFAFYEFISQEFIWGIITLILSLVLIVWGRSQRFDYKMQSGTMVHRGDW